ncbi:MFS transporter [Streptomyces sp. NPDC059639]|uniref:MFS transporter n=1 Tax=Streptomyces sp. NPDC059639 TaxID=3346891 RepID=UPI0036CBCDD4
MTQAKTVGPGALPAPGSPARWSPRLWALLAVLAGNMLIDALEVSTAVVAAPSIGADLGLSPAVLQATLTGFALGFGMLLPVAGRLAAARGRRTCYLWALFVFALASLVAALTTDPALLLATRVVKGGCAALTAPTGLAIIVARFGQGRDRDRAVSVYTLFGAGGFTVGLLLSGLLTEIGWRWTLAMPAPAVLLLLLVGRRLIPRDGPDGRPPAPRAGIDARARPALRVRGALLRSAVGAACLNGSHLGLLLILTLRLQGADGPGWGPMRTGLALLPASAPLMLAALSAGRIIRRFGTARLIAVGALLPLMGFMYYLGSGPGTDYGTDILPALLLVGLGFVLCFAALNRQATTGVPASTRPRATAAYQAAVQAGAVLVVTPTALLWDTCGDAAAAVLLCAVGAFGLCAAVIGLPAGRDA